MEKIYLLIMSVLVAGVAAAQGTWTIDKAHSKVGFNVSHFAVSEVEGLFKDYDAKISSTAADFDGAEIEFSAKTASIFTDNERRDTHLKSDDFFNAEKYPEIKFKGKLVKEGSGYVLKGDFTMRDVTKPATFEVTYGGSTKAFGSEKAGFKLRGKINRFDYNLKWDKMNGADLIVGKEVEIVCKVELNKKA